MSAKAQLARPVLWILRRSGDSRRRLHTAVVLIGVMLCAGGVLAYGLVSPEIPFAEAPVTLVSEAHADETVKVYGKVVCRCTKAIDREETQVGATGRTWNATYEPFNITDPSGALHVDTTSITRLTPGPSGGDWLNDDWIAIYGNVYDQGNGNLILRAQMVAKVPDDTPARYAFWMLVSGAAGALAIAYVLTDRFVFGGAET